MNNPLISIIVPVYNKPLDQLNRCIDSLINQTLKNIEILIINDGSNNGCEQVCFDKSKMDNRIKLFNQINLGVSSARNLGIEHARAQYIMFVDSDDWIEFDCCEVAYNITTNKKLDLLFWTYMKDYATHSIFYKPHIKNELNIFDLTFLGSTCKVLYSKILIDTMRFDCNLKNGEDVEFNLRVFKRAEKYEYINRAFYHYTIQSSSAVRTFDESTIVNYKTTLKAIDKNCTTEADKEVYFSFMAISYLMIVLNLISHNNVSLSIFKKIKKIKKISQLEPFKDMVYNLDKIELPFTRKLAFYFIRIKFYLGVYLIIIAKNILDCKEETNE